MSSMTFGLKNARQITAEADPWEDGGFFSWLLNGAPYPVEMSPTFIHIPTFGDAAEREGTTQSGGERRMVRNYGAVVAYTKELMSGAHSAHEHRTSPPKISASEADCRIIYTPEDGHGTPEKLMVRHHPLWRAHGGMDGQTSISITMVPTFWAQLRHGFKLRPWTLVFSCAAEKLAAA